MLGPIPASVLLAAMLGSRGRLRLAQDDPSRAVEDLACRTASQRRPGSVEPPWQPPSAEALVLADRVAEAAAEAEPTRGSRAAGHAPCTRACRSDGRAARPGDRVAPGCPVALRGPPRPARARAHRDGARRAATRRWRPPCRARDRPRRARHCPHLPCDRPMRACTSRSCSSPAAARVRPRAPERTHSHRPSGAWPRSSRAGPPTGRSPAVCSSLPRRSRCTCAVPTASSSCRAAKGSPPRCAESVQGQVDGIRAADSVTRRTSRGSEHPEIPPLIDVG
jgi:hypothetical protein